MLTVEGFSVPILPGTRVGHIEHGDMDRAYSGRLRTDRRALHRVVQVQAAFFDATDTAALRVILNTPGPVLCGGTMIGDAAYFHVRGLAISPVRSDLFQFAFELHETDDQPSALLFSFDGDAFGTYTFTRSGTVGPYTDADGVLQSAAANVFRREYLWLADGALPDTASGLLDGAATNLVSSDNFDSGWTSDGTPVVTGSISDPAGGTAAYRIADDDGAAVEGKVLNITFTGDGTKIVTFTVREATMPASGVQKLQIFDVTAAANRLSLDISAWTVGEPTVAASVGTYIGKRQLGDGYWLLYGLTSSVTAANTNRAAIYPAGTAAETGSIDIYRVNAFNGTQPPWSVLDASEVLAAETWYASYGHVPQVMTGLVDFIEGMHPTWGANYRVLQIGNAGGTGARLMVYRESGFDTYAVQHVDGDGNSVLSAVDINPAWGNRIRLRWVLNANGSVQIGAAKDTGSGFGAETVGTASAAQTLPSAWADTRLYLSHPGVPGIAPYITAKVAAGVYTMAEIVNLAKGRLHPRQVLP